MKLKYIKHYVVKMYNNGDKACGIKPEYKKINKNSHRDIINIS